MDYMTRRATRHKTLVAQGVYTGELRQERAAFDQWRLECTHVSHITRDAAKEAVTAYLHDEFDAYGISFFIAKAGKPNAFFVRFHTTSL